MSLRSATGENTENRYRRASYRLSLSDISMSLSLLKIANSNHTFLCRFSPVAPCVERRVHSFSPIFMSVKWRRTINVIAESKGHHRSFSPHPDYLTISTSDGEVQTSVPKVKLTPRSFSPHPAVSLSGSDQSKSQSNPWSGTSVGRMIRRICSIACRSGESPPWQQKIFSSTVTMKKNGNALRCDCCYKTGTQWNI